MKKVIVSYRQLGLISLAVALVTFLNSCSVTETRYPMVRVPKKEIKWESKEMLKANSISLNNTTINSALETEPIVASSSASEKIVVQNERKPFRSEQSSQQFSAKTNRIIKKLDKIADQKNVFKSQNLNKKALGSSQLVIILLVTVLLLVLLGGPWWSWWSFNYLLSLLLLVLLILLILYLAGLV